MLNLYSKKKKYSLLFNFLFNQQYVIFVQNNYKFILNNSTLNQIQSFFFNSIKKKIPYFFFTQISKQFFKKNYKGNAINAFTFFSSEIFYKFIGEQKYFNILFFSILKKNYLYLYFYSAIQLKEYIHSKMNLILNLNKIILDLLINLNINLNLLIKIIQRKLQI